MSCPWIEFKNQKPSPMEVCLVVTDVGQYMIAEWFNSHWSPVAISACERNNHAWSLQFVKWWMPLPEKPHALN